MALDDETPVTTPESETPTPDDQTKDRTTEQFDKLKQSNQDLKAERDQEKAEKEQYKSLFESLRPQDVPQQTQQTYQQPINQAPNAQNFSNLNQGDVNQVFQSMVDENGYLDGQKLMGTLQSMNERATRAEQAAVQATQEVQKIQKTSRDKEETEAQLKVYTKYPGLNPNDKENFDSKFWDYVYNELAATAKRGQMPSEADYMSAADKVYTDFYEGREDMKKTTAKKAETEDAKRQINATRPRSPMNLGYYASEEDNALIAKVQQGKKGAVAELLKRRGQ